MPAGTGILLYDTFKVTDTLKKDEHSAVYLAEHVSLQKHVILKVLNTQNLPDTTILARFNREARIIETLEHPNVISSIEAGVADESCYICFEYFEAKSLRHWIKHHAELSPEQKMWLLRQLYRGLAYAHGQQILHRDLKPENILVGDDLTLKIVDFGLALAFTDTLVTAQYSVVGTPGYMSPEQILGEKLTPASDLFSAAVVSLELLTGENPFLGPDVNETINNIISFSEEKGIPLLDNVPEPAAVALRGLLKREPQSRIASATAVLDILGDTDYMGTLTLRRRPVKRRKPRYLPVAVAVAMIIIGAVLFFVLNRGASRVTGQFQQDSVSFTSPGLVAQDTGMLPPAKLKKDTAKAGVTAVLPDTAGLAKSKETPPPVTQPAVKQNGQLFVECKPWAHVYIDSLRVETTPLKSNITLLEGTYLLRLAHPNYPAYSRRIAIRPQEVLSVRVDLDTLFGYLDCRLNPWGRVFVNGEDKGITPFRKPLALVPGEYSVRLLNDKYQPVEMKVQISRNQTFILKHAFRDSN